MKKLLTWFLALCMTVSIGSCAIAQADSAYQAGTYTSTQFGMGGYFDVCVTFSDDEIVSIDASDNKETLMVGTEAIRILTDRVLTFQSLDLDAISGATYSSYAFIAGVKDCVKQAGGDVEALTQVPVTVDTYTDDSHEADIIIVGAGQAGITAALSAKDNGGDVILLEQKAYVGGNSVMSTGTFIFGGTSIQAGLDIEDDADTFEAWANENSGNDKDPVQVKMVAQNGQNLIDYYETLGVGFNTKKVNATDNSKVNRGHAASPNIGTMMTVLRDQLEAKGVDVRYNTHADGLITDESGAVIGVTATDYEGNTTAYYGKHIVLATGGWGANHDMIVENWGEDYTNIVYGGATGMDGAMLNAAVAMGADTTDMDDVHIDATFEVTRGITITTNLLRNCGGILVRTDGTRFADEPTSHCEVAAAVIHELGDAYYYEIVDSSMFEYSEAVTAKANSYVNMGLTKQYDTVEDMAAGIGVDVAVLKSTIDAYNAAARGEAEDPFGRTTFADELQAPYYVLKVANGVACTTGGLKINERLQVLDTNGSVISGLYGIGETTGGYRIHYVGGDSLSHSAITGMLIGQWLTADAE